MQLIAPLLFLAVSLSGHTAFAQKPAVIHTQLSVVSAEHGLGAEIDKLKRSASPLWAGYSIPVGPDFHMGENVASVEYLFGKSNGRSASL